MSRHQEFWNKEYRQPEHLALSDNPSEDLEKFTRWINRSYGGAVFNRTSLVLDLGCGNGRNLIYLAKNFGCRGVGYDISEEAISQAKRTAAAVHPDMPKLLKFDARSIAGPLTDVADESMNVVLDMMTSHFLKATEREALRAEILRVLKFDGWFFFKSFLAEGDLHVDRLLKEHPADEPGAYIHPKMGVYEHVWTLEEIHAFFGPYFEIHKIEKSHKHIMHGKAFKRRTVTVYLQKK